MHVTENHRTQVLANLRDGVVHARFELGFHRLKLRLQPFAHRLTQHREPALPSLPAAMREAKEVESLRRTSIPAIHSITPRTAAELDQPRLLGVQFQPEVREPLAQLGKEPLCLDSMLEPNGKTSAKRTTMTSPRACFCLHRWTHRSNT
jgi:GMP synthase-like glutamine amidotransferase